ncbi:MAG: DUF1127 domain-containing protein [Saccharospirillum sp.]|nr:DUF1127 domain-containing protein [Saccharospirillum sp.]
MTQITVSQSTLCCDFEQVGRARQGLREVLRRYWRRYQSRQDLFAMTDYQLRDLGLTRDQVTREAIKPFWR